MLIVRQGRKVKKRSKTEKKVVFSLLWKTTFFEMDSDKTS